MDLEQRMQNIRMILSDVDGILTDGGITYDNQGIETKKFHVRDGLGIKLWQRAGHQFGILTARSSHLVKLRASELGIELVRQGSSDKLAVAQSILEASKTTDAPLTMQEVCYIGDDLTDIPLLQQAGLAATVTDGAEEVRHASQYTIPCNGGCGAVRTLIETILKSQQRWTEVVQDYTNSLN